MQVKVFEELLGQTFSRVEGVEDGEVMTFWFDDSHPDLLCAQFFHNYQCCESVTIESITGDISDLAGSPLLMAEEVSDGEDWKSNKTSRDPYGSQEWTFYKFATIKGSVTVRWYGESNGYYSTDVNFKVFSRDQKKWTDCPQQE